MSTLFKHCNSLKHVYSDSDKSNSSYQSCNEMSHVNSQNSFEIIDDSSMYTNSHDSSNSHHHSARKSKKSKRNHKIKSEKNSFYDDALGKKIILSEKDNERMDFLLFADEVTEENYDKANRFLLKLDEKNIILTDDEKHVALREFLNDSKSARKYFQKVNNNKDQMKSSEHSKESNIDGLQENFLNSDVKLEKDHSCASSSIFSYQTNDSNLHDIKTNDESSLNYQNQHSFKSTKASSYHDFYMNNSYLSNDNPLKYMFSLKDLTHRNLKKIRDYDAMNDLPTKDIDFSTQPNENLEKINNPTHEETTNSENKMTELKDHSLCDQENFFKEFKNISSYSSVKQNSSTLVSSCVVSNETITNENNELKNEFEDFTSQPNEKPQKNDSKFPTIRTQTFLIDEGACGDSLSAINSHRRLSKNKIIPEKALFENNSYDSEAFMVTSDHAVISDSSSEKKIDENFDIMSEVSNVKSLYRNMNDDVCSEAFTKMSSSCKFDIIFDDDLMNVEEEAEPTISINSTTTRISRISLNQADREKKRKAAYDEWIRTISAREKQKKEQLRKKMEQEYEKAQLKKSLNEQKLKKWNKRKDKEAIEKMAHFDELKRRSLQEKISKRNTKKVFKKALTHEEWLAQKNQEVKRKLLEIKEKQEKEAKRKEEEIRMKEQMNEEAYHKWLERTKNVAKPVPFGEGLSSLRGSTTEIFENPNPWITTIESN
ncbi:hypothetical protein PVAND_012798 [Polypedilum vanderplanki]|uniref:Coiled-coil domain-containing protein n=1 Tax=Polypedilum vanderplanki TaxID=319348 RepID=A0A9J6CNN5_POLVA|nr:hypothetical protein PVAND_012798 [Polypedilum vanderplanki]